MSQPSKPPKKIRLDQLLVERGLAESRQKAQRLILANAIRCQSLPNPKPGSRVPFDLDIQIIQPDRYVSRAGHKLEAALHAFALNPTGHVCLDVGASTGGFTDCLLQHGACRVYALDVGHGQLHARLRSDPQVIPIEGINARLATPDLLPEKPTFASIDVSFISLTLILHPVLALLAEHAHIILLIKPQFELQPHLIPPGGIVLDPVLHSLAVQKIQTFCTSIPGILWHGFIPSPTLGAKGNQEFLAYLEKIPQPPKP